MIRFGPSGNSESFYGQGYKSSVDMPAWLRKMGLSAYEYQCSKGVKIGEAAAKLLGDEAAKNDIFLSIHAPYYINLSSEEHVKRVNSARYIMESLMAARWMGAKRVIVHPGSCSKVSREWALNTAVKGLKEIIFEADNLGFSDIAICPEVLGKINQLGTLEEILTMCAIDERLVPTIDFAHIHARGIGSLNTLEDFYAVINKIENVLGTERLKKIHCHFSRVEFTKGGEKRHMRLSDVEYGPDFRFFAEIIHKKNMEPIIICESMENMAEDALRLKNIYETFGG